jgi:hypothetical protein
VIDSAKKVLGIHSPSKVFREEVGVMIGKGLANGIKDSTKDAKNASSEMGKGVYEAAKDWIDERKYYNKLSLEEELYVWEEVQKQYEQGSTNSINADKEIYRVKKEIRQEEYNDSIKWIDERKYYNELSLQEELAAWERVQKRYEEGSEERIKADKEVYRVKNELTKADYQNSVDWIDGRKYYNELSLQEELEAWERVQKRYAEGTDERIKADKEVYRVKNELTKADYQNSIDWIDERKYYNELSLGQELAAWQRVQKRYDEGTEERKKADREVYRVKKEITEKMKSLEDDYYEKTKSVNEKLKADIEKLNTEYDNAVKSRADSLYNAYGLFDKVGEEEAVSGDELFSNLQDQLVAFTNWRENIKSLASKGVGDDFIKELESMGPKSAVQIKALNSLSSDKLDDYVTLWKAKHNLAKTQAVGELEDLRVETQVKIGEITTQSQTELDKLRTTWYSEMDKINYSTTAQLATLNQTWNQNTTEIKTQGISNFMELASSIASIDWVGVGIKIVKGITDGANTQTSALANTIMSATSKAIEAAKELLGDNSALSPTITPVLDLSNIKTGGSEILSFLSGNPVISTISKGISLAGMVANNIAQQAQSTGETTVEKSEPTQINNTYNVTANVREESDIKKVARQIYNLQVTGDRG